jgi:hypothetical protein
MDRTASRANRATTPASALAVHFASSVGRIAPTTSGLASA